MHDCYPRGSGGGGAPCQSLHAFFPFFILHGAFSSVTERLDGSWKEWREVAVIPFSHLFLFFVLFFQMHFKC